MAWLNGKNTIFEKNHILHFWYFIDNPSRKCYFLNGIPTRDF